jgi:drug/metabolite transporter (DMT)-like permease
MNSATSSIAAVRGASANVRGIGWMLVTGFFFVGVTGIVRHLGTDMQPVQAAFLRYVIGLVMLSPLLFRAARTPIISKRMGMHAVRGLVHGTGVMLWFYAMARIPIAEVTALGFTAPIFTTVGAALFLGERLQARRIGAVLVAFGGAMVILRPGVEAIQIGALAQVAAAPLFATSFLLAKKLTETESSASIVAYLSVFVTIALLPPALMVWRTPTWEELGWLTVVAALATTGHYTLTRAFKATEITVTQPFSFLQLVWATALGFYAFGEQPDTWTIIGGALIVGSATYIAHRESRRIGHARPKAMQGLLDSANGGPKPRT